MQSIVSLVEFRSPPVVEVVCGVQFEPLAKFGAVHLGVFWGKVRADLPLFKQLAPLPNVVENIDQPQAGLSYSLDLGSAQIPLVQFFEKTGEQYVTLQGTRFLHNWQKVPGGDYRRYRTIRPAFLEHWTRFLQFVQEENLGGLTVNQYEMSYINHVPAGELWDDKRGLKGVLPWFTPRNPIVDSVFEPEVALHSLVPRCRGRLHVSGKVGLRASDRARVLQLELTVRGAPEASDATDLASWMDAAREVIVRSFVELTSDEARQHWGQTK
jgi:uncharacterized protein (TIGR04255 family)